MAFCRRLGGEEQVSRARLAAVRSEGLGPQRRLRRPLRALACVSIRDFPRIM